MFDKFKKTSIGLLLTLFILTSVFGSLVMVKPAKAGGVFTNVTLDTLGATFFVESIKEKIAGDLEERIKVGVFQAIMRMTSYFIQKVSYDLAVFTASGGKGQGGLVFNQGFEGYMKDVGDHAVGSAIDELGNALGLNLCKPPNIMMDLTLRLGLKGKYCDPETGQGGEGEGVCKPHCTLSDFKKNWSKVGGGDYWEDTAKQFNLAIEPSQSDMGIFLEANARIDKIKAKAEKGAEAERVEGKGAKPFEKMISGEIKTPGTVIMHEQEKAAPGEKAAEAKANMNASYSTGFAEMPAFAASVFLNTFLSTVLKGFMEDGMLFGACVTSKCKGGEEEDYGNLAGDYGGNIPSGGYAAAKEYFKDLLKVDLGTIENFDLLAKFTVCDKNSKGAHNCVADSLFIQAVKRDEMGQPLTIAEAMKSPELDLLHSDWKLRSDEYYDGNKLALKEDCFREAYCLHNIKKLRQARILPLGFEIAASLSTSEFQPTLKDVVDGFHIKNSRYYHLIDPEWVLKMPKTRCETYAYGPDPQAGTSIRLQECVDLKSCIKEREDGECETYGYCAMERNIWKFDLNSCSPQYRTCQAFTSSAGEQVGYVTRSTDGAYCDNTNVGCSAYSDVWMIVDREGPITRRTWNYIYANKADSCSASNIGCTAFRIADDPEVDPIYLKKGPNLASRNVSETGHNVYNYSCYNVFGNPKPKTKSELNKLNIFLEERGFTEICDQYAKPCIPEEKDCNFYNPITYPGVDIPAKFNPATTTENQIVWNDQCDQSCVGYNAYEELSSNYSNGVSLDYIIPQSGNTCNNPGCSAFTNLSTATGQTEDVEHYSYLRPCVKPNIKPQKTYITYETTLIEGYQLKTYLLEEETVVGDIDGGLTGAIGAPKYFYRTTGDLDIYKDVCNEAVYWGGADYKLDTHDQYWDDELSPDCRQINDETGNIYYRLLSKTIAVSGECTSYRLNNTDLYIDENISETDCSTVVDVIVSSTVGYWDATDNTCKVCFQNGEYRNGFCYYEGMPSGSYHSAGVSDGCPAGEDTCRAYKGNAGNNIEEIFLDSFESSSTTIALANWGAINENFHLSTESTQSNGHSLAINYPTSGNTVTKGLPEDTVIKDGSYELTFWAKGTANKFKVKIGGVEYFDEAREYSVSDDWKNYSLKLINLEIDPTTSTIEFEISDSQPGRFYLDNVRLVKVQEHINLVKKSLNIPSVCDANQYDEYPGEALGCATYGYNSLGQTNQAHLTNFSYLCREDAVGCTELIDTHNTAESEARAYNVWLMGTGNTSPTVTINGDAFGCSIPLGEDGCYIPVIDGVTKAQINSDASDFVNLKTDKSTMYVPAESTAEKIFLVANEEASCNSADEGCVKVGKLNSTASGSKFDEMYLKLNDPDLYTDILCEKRSLGCEKFTSRDGSDFYFKDPELTGKICEFKEGVDWIDTEVLHKKADGWFWKDVGKCFDGTTYGNDYCNENTDCLSSETCEKKGDWPCYHVLEDDFVGTGGGYFGLWSFGMTRYRGFVGECPLDEHGCTKFVDHNDEDNFNRDKAYYYLANEKLDDRIADCEGMAGIKGGCVLLDKTDDPTKLYHTKDTYDESRFEEDAQLVIPIDRYELNDANRIVKAVHDRECAAWFYCSAPDMEHGDCDALGVCDKVDNNKADRCASDGVITDSWPLSKKTITYEKTTCPDTSRTALNYYCRSVAWDAPEYSGYTMHQGSQMVDMHNEILISDEGVYEDKKSCRVYPTADSPYSRSIIPYYNFNMKFTEFELKPPFNAVNLFYDEYRKDDCGYTKVSYNNDQNTLYYTVDDVSYPLRYCLGGFANQDVLDVDGSQDEPCVFGGGVVQKLDQRIEVVKGEEGYCLEYDTSRVINNTGVNVDGDPAEYACLTWIPVTIGDFGFHSNGDTNMQEMGAMYTYDPTNPSQDKNRYMCLYNKALTYFPIPEVLDYPLQFKILFKRIDITEGYNDFSAGVNSYVGEENYFPKFIKDDIRFKADRNYNKSRFRRNTDNEKYKPAKTGLLIQPQQVCAFGKTNQMNDETFMCAYNSEEYDYSLSNSTKKYHDIYNYATKAREPDGGLPFLNNPFILRPNRHSIKYAPLNRLATGKTEHLDHYLHDLLVTNIYKEDIERIDVYIDDDEAQSYLPALVSFIPDLMIEGGRLSSTYEESNESKKQIFGIQNGVSMPGVGDGTYSWWGWQSGRKAEWNGNQNLNWSSLFNRESGDNESSQLALSIVSNGYGYTGQRDSDPDNFLSIAIGTRIWFDENDLLKGFEYTAVDELPNGEAQISLVYFIYLNNGECKEIAQVWADGGTNKAYNANMSESNYIFDYTKDHLEGVPSRDKSTANFSEYGLVKNGFNPIINKYQRIGVDPLPKNVLEDEGTNISPYPNYDTYLGYWWKKGAPSDYYEAGIPLTYYRNRDDTNGYEKTPLLNRYPPADISEVGKDNTLYRLLLHKMFAKVHSVWMYRGSELGWETQDLSYDISDPYYEHYPKSAPQIRPVKVLHEDCPSNSTDDLSKSCGRANATGNSFSIDGYYPGILQKTADYEFELINYLGDVAYEESHLVTLAFYIDDEVNQLPLSDLKIDTDSNSVIFRPKGEIKLHKYECPPNSHGYCYPGFASQTFTYTCHISRDMFIHPEEVYDGKDYTEWRITDINSADRYVEGIGGLAGLKIEPYNSEPSIDIDNNIVQVNEDVLDRAGLGNLEDGNLVCVYAPKVQVSDNWEWCTGTCDGTYDGSTLEGCFGAWCTMETSQSWVSAGRVIIAPREVSTGSGHESDSMDWDFLEDFLGSE